MNDSTFEKLPEKSQIEFEDGLIVTWDGSEGEDPHNPMNWPKWKKWSNIGVLSFTAFLTYDVLRLFQHGYADKKCPDLLRPLCWRLQCPPSWLT